MTVYYYTVVAMYYIRTHNSEISAAKAKQMSRDYNCKYFWFLIYE